MGNCDALLLSPVGWKNKPTLSGHIKANQPDRTSSLSKKERTSEKKNPSVPPQYPVAYLFLRERRILIDLLPHLLLLLFLISFISSCLWLLFLFDQSLLEGMHTNTSWQSIWCGCTSLSFSVCAWLLSLVSCFFFPFVFVFFNVSLPLVEQGNKIPNAEAYTVLASSAQIDRDQKRRISIDYHIYPSVCTRVILHVQSSDQSTNQSILLTHPLVSSWAEAKRDWTRLDPQKRLSLSPFSFRLASMANCRPATYQLVIVSLFFFFTDRVLPVYWLMDSSASSARAPSFWLARCAARVDTWLDRTNRWNESTPKNRSWEREADRCHLWPSLWSDHHSNLGRFFSSHPAAALDLFTVRAYSFRLRTHTHSTWM